MIDTSPAQFTAMLLIERHHAVTYAALAKEVALIAPSARLGDWSGPIIDPSKASGIDMLSLDGQQMAVLAVDAPAPAIALDFGPLPNLLWPDPSSEIARHRAHVMIVSPGDATSRADAVAKARAVTIVAAAYAAIVRTIGVVWVDAANLLPPEIFARSVEKIGMPGGTAVPFWVRVQHARVDGAGERRNAIVAGTLGLAALGHPELEYAPAATAPGTITAHAMAVAGYLLASGKTLKAGDTLGADGGQQFVVTARSAGSFTGNPVLQLEAKQ